MILSDFDSLIQVGGSLWQDGGGIDTYVPLNSAAQVISSQYIYLCTARTSVLHSQEALMTCCSSARHSYLVP